MGFLDKLLGRRKKGEMKSEATEPASMPQGGTTPPPPPPPAAEEPKPMGGEQQPGGEGR
jgi:hypothetical protein